MSGDAHAGPTGDRKKWTRMVKKLRLRRTNWGPTETLLGSHPESCEMAWETKQKRTSPVECHDPYAGSPGNQQNQTSLVEHHAGIVVKSSREYGPKTKNYI